MTSLGRRRKATRVLLLEPRKIINRHGLVRKDISLQKNELETGSIQILGGTSGI